MRPVYSRQEREDSSIPQDRTKESKKEKSAKKERKRPRPVRSDINVSADNEHRMASDIAVTSLIYTGGFSGMSREIMRRDRVVMTEIAQLVLQVEICGV
ncbi:hypothetical protein Tco_0511223 [Tanacetum coccineum]